MENNKNNMSKCFEAMREIKAMKPKKPLIIKDPDSQNIIGNKSEQTKIITNHFKNQFYKQAPPIPNIQPKPMRKPFTSEEIKKAVKRLKNNKSPGADNVKAELLKYGNDEIFEEIAIILNGVATTGEHPDELTHGILTPLQKPGKARGPTENLRPIILFSLLRKILAICILERSKERINNAIPVTQAAYKQGRSTTEHTFAIKTLVEWAIT